MVSEKFKFYLKAIIIIISSLLFSVIIVVCSLGSVFNPMPNYTKIEKSFRDNKEILVEVTNFLSKSLYPEVYISDTMEKGTMFTGAETGDIQIENENVIKSIFMLKRKGYSVIEKNENTIIFQKWTKKR